MKHYTVPIFVPELACPNRCVFCNQNSISGCHSQPDPEEVKLIIEERLHTIPKVNTHIEIGFFGGNFTGIDERQQKEYLEIAQKYYHQNDVHGIRLSTRPDYITPQSLDLLKQFNVTTIELGAQSLDEDVLKLAGRGHTIEDIEYASKLIHKYGFRLGLQMMTGLPGDTVEKSIKTANKIIELGASDVRIYPTLVIKNTELEKLWLSGTYKPQSLDEAVNLSAALIDIFNKAGLNIIRVGLHPSDDLLRDMLAGPFHPSFRQLAEKKVTFTKKNDLVNGLDSSSDEQKVVIPLIIADKRIPLPSKNALRNMGELEFPEENSTVYKTIAAHPDIFMCAGDHKVVVSPGFSNKTTEKIKARGYTVINGAGSPEGKYPQTAKYNAVVTANLLIHNLKITDQVILDTFNQKKLVHVNQGYTRCNLLPLTEFRFITSDRGIEKALVNEGMEVLWVDPQPVVLKGQKHGFFPGCCGLAGDSVLINGSLNFHYQGEQIREFILSSELKIRELFQGKLTDCGSIFTFMPNIDR